MAEYIWQSQTIILSLCWQNGGTHYYPSERRDLLKSPQQLIFICIYLAKKALQKFRPITYSGVAFYVSMSQSSHALSEININALNFVRHKTIFMFNQSTAWAQKGAELILLILVCLQLDRLICYTYTRAFVLTCDLLNVRNLYVNVRLEA